MPGLFCPLLAVSNVLLSFTKQQALNLLQLVGFSRREGPIFKRHTIFPSKVTLLFQNALKFTRNWAKGNRALEFCVFENSDAIERL